MTWLMDGDLRPLVGLSSMYLRRSHYISNSSIISHQPAESLHTRSESLHKVGLDLWQTVCPVPAPAENGHLGA
jgi:hypothetical protein